MEVAEFHKFFHQELFQRLAIQEVLGEHVEDEKRKRGSAMPDYAPIMSSRERR